VLELLMKRELDRHRRVILFLSLLSIRLKMYFAAAANLAGDFAPIFRTATAAPEQYRLRCGEAAPHDDAPGKRDIRRRLRSGYRWSPPL